MTFQKGQSGNPTGKPSGLTPRALFREQVRTAMPEIVANLVEQAQGGDLIAIRIILDRCVPALKPTADATALPDAPAGTLAERGMAIITASAAGQLSPDDAASNMALLTAQAKLVEQTEIVQRLELIENALRK